MTQTLTDVVIAAQREAATARDAGIAQGDRTRAERRAARAAFHTQQIKLLDAMIAKAQELDGKLVGVDGYLAKAIILKHLGFSRDDQQRRLNELG